MQTKLKFEILLICSCFLLHSVQGSANSGLPAGLELTAEMSKQLIASPDQAVLNVTVTNLSSQTISFNRQNTLLDIVVPAGAIDVSVAGSSLFFNAPHLKRKASSSNDEINIAAGSSASNTIHLASYFDMQSSGSYSVKLIGQDSSLINFESLQASPAKAKQTFAYRACNSSQRTQINSGFTQAEIMARKAYMDLNNTPVSARPTAPRFNRWFGTYTEPRYNKILAAFNKIDNAIGTQQVSFDCGCTAVAPENRKFVFAYVYANKPNVINLCSAFWNSSNAGVDSRGGTIIHELSHFLVLGGANSASNYAEVYGTSAALALAQSNPVHAVNNAENHGYFAENIPEFKMSTQDVRDCEIETLGSASSTGQPNTFTFDANSLSQAVDNLNYNMLTGGASFINTNGTSTRGGDSARSGKIANNGQSIMATFVTGPGKVQFDWRVSSEGGKDGIIFQMDNASSTVTTDSISGESPWISKSFNIPSGGHTILWAYVKDGSGAVGQDAGWIDSVVISGAAAGNFANSGVKDTVLKCTGGITLAPVYHLLLDDD